LTPAGAPDAEEMEFADDTQEASSSSDLTSREACFSLFVKFAKEVIQLAFFKRSVIIIIIIS